MLPFGHLAIWPAGRISGKFERKREEELNGGGGWQGGVGLHQPWQDNLILTQEKLNFCFQKPWCEIQWEIHSSRVRRRSWLGDVRRRRLTSCQWPPPPVVGLSARWTKPHHCHLLLWTPCKVLPHTSTGEFLGWWSRWTDVKKLTFWQPRPWSWELAVIENRRIPQICHWLSNLFQSTFPDADQAFNFLKKKLFPF